MFHQRLILGWSRFGQVEQRRQQIDANDRLVTFFALRDLARPARDERHTMAAFVDHALPPAQGKIFGDAFAGAEFAVPPTPPLSLLKITSVFSLSWSSSSLAMIRPTLSSTLAIIAA